MQTVLAKYSFQKKLRKKKKLGVFEEWKKITIGLERIYGLSKKTGGFKKWQNTQYIMSIDHRRNNKVQERTYLRSDVRNVGNSQKEFSTQRLVPRMVGRTHPARDTKLGFYSVCSLLELSYWIIGNPAKWRIARYRIQTNVKTTVVWAIKNTGLPILRIIAGWPTLAVSVNVHQCGIKLKEDGLCWLLHIKKTV